MRAVIVASLIPQSGNFDSASTTRGLGREEDAFVNSENPIEAGHGISIPWTNVNHRATCASPPAAKINEKTAIPIKNNDWNIIHDCVIKRPRTFS